MEAIFQCCAGLDVHQKTVWACVRRLEPNGRFAKETRCFGTMTANLIELAKWLKESGASHAAMESTGVLWKPVYNILEEHLEVWLCNAHHVKNVPGRKTDAKDCEWLAQLLQCGLLRPSFVPPKPVRELRDLTRSRTCIEDDRTRVVNRIHKELEDANIKLGAVASDIMGVSGRAILQQLIDGQSDPQELAKLAKGRLKSKQPALYEALRGHVSEHHRFMLRLLMDQVRSLECSIRQLDERIDQLMAAADAKTASEAVAGVSIEPVKCSKKEEAKAPLPFLAAMKLLVDMWGLDKRSAQNVIAEIGTDMYRFPTDKHFVSWAAMCPGNNRSAEKNRSGATQNGNVWLRRAITQASWAASRAKKSFFSARYKRLVRRRGKQRSIVAVGHSMLRAIYHMLKNHMEFNDLGVEHYQKRVNEASVKRSLVKSLERLGYTVTLQQKGVA